MKSKIMVLIGIFIVSMFIAGSAFCDTCAHDKGEGRGHSKDKMASIKKELALTAEQDKLLADAKSAHRADMKSLTQALKTKHEELKTALAKPGVTKENLEPIASQIKALQSQMVDRRIDGILNIKHILSPEQFQKMQSLKDGWHKDRHMKSSEKKQ